MRPRDQDRIAEALADEAAHHFQRGRGKGELRRNAGLGEDAGEVGPAWGDVEQDERLIAQGIERHVLLPAEGMPGRQEDVGVEGRERGDAPGTLTRKGLAE